MAVDPLRKAHAEGQRLRDAIDTEYRSARRNSTWGRTEPQMVERWHLRPRSRPRPARAPRGWRSGTRWRARWRLSAS